MKFPLNARSASLLLLGSVNASIHCQSLAAEEISNETVAVIRGGHISTQRMPHGPPAEAATQDDVVVVMRPESGSFLRETTRLANEAQAREDRASAEQARVTNQQVSEALEAIEQAAETVRDQSPRQRVILVPLGHGISINPKTRQLHEPTGKPIGRKPEPR